MSVRASLGCRSRGLRVLAIAGLLLGLMSVALPRALADPVADASSAPDAGTAVLIAQTYGHPVVVDSDTTETEQVSAQPDGSFVLSESSDPVRVQQGGSWVPVDTSLTTQSGGMLAPVAAAVPVAFSAGGSGPLAQVQGSDGSWLSESWPAGVLPAPSVSGSTATYANVFPGVDLQLTATSVGMSSVLVIKDAAAASDPGLAAVRFAISGTSVSPVAGTGTSAGAAAVAAGDGLTSASPSWWDSATAGTTAAGPGGVAVPEPVPSSVSGSVLTVDAATAAQAPGSVFPVYVDPDWSPAQQGRTFTDKAYPTQSYWNGSGASDAYQHVGYVEAAESDDGKAHTTRSFWQYPLSTVTGKKILKATFDTDEVYSYSCQAREVDLWATSAIWPSTTWNSNPALVTEIDSQNVAYGYDSACPAHTVGFDATSEISALAANGNSAIALGLKAANESDTYTWKKFSASATLTISYDSEPTTPTGLSVSGCSFVCGSPAYTKDTTPTLTAESTDPDGGNLSYVFEIIQGQSASPSAPYYRVDTVSGVPEGTVARDTTATLPAGAYEYRVYSTDGTWSSPGDSALFRFTVDVTPPAAPQVAPAPNELSTNAAAPAGTVGVTTETITISPGASSTDDAWGYAYAITPDASSVTFPANLTCNTAVAGYTTVCPGSVNAAVTVTITAPDDTSSFAAITFDAAGNTHGPASSTVSFYALPDTASMGAGHSWSTDTATVACPEGQLGPVLDTATSAGQDLAVSGTACWGKDATAPNAQGGLGAGVLSYTGAATTPDTVTSSPVLSTTAAYTVAAWVLPSTTGGFYDVMGQNGSDQSAFVLQESNSSWSFCVTSTDTSSWSGHCADSIAGSVIAGQWAFIVGQYNPTDQTVTLRISNPVTMGNLFPQGLQTPIVTSQPGTASQPGTFAATGPLQVGGGRISAADRPWDGEVLDPVAVQGIADTDQLTQLMKFHTPSSMTGGQ